MPNVSIDWEYFLRFSLIADIGGINKVLVKINRNIDRNSITKNRYNVNRANRELIKNFKFEYPRLILSKHYKYALKYHPDKNKNELASEKFKDLSEKADNSLDQKKELIDQNLIDMKKTIKSLHDQSIKLTGNLENSNKETQKLQESTRKLSDILS